MNRPHVIAITGGIGSGKSVVSKMLKAMGYPVYDCDYWARMLMDESDEIKELIAEEISAECLNADGEIDRKTLSKTVFECEEKLAKLNAIVHGAVRSHLCDWIDAREGETRCFFETAILYQSGFDSIADEVWCVDAPSEVRIERVMKRNGLTREEVIARINSQSSALPTVQEAYFHYIDNDGDTPVLPRIERLLGEKN